MSKKDVLLYITPYLKTMSKKGKGYYLLLDNILVYLNMEESQLIVANLPNRTEDIICMDKDSILNILKNIDDISLDSINWIDYRYYYKLLEFYQFYSGRNKIEYEIDNITSIEEVYNFVTMKSSSTPQLYHLHDKIMLPFFYGVLPANKNDVINIKLYENDNYSDIVKYQIVKTKPKCVIDVYMKLMRLG